MQFERQQYKTHLIDNHKIEVSYDRFTTRFNLSINEQRVYTRLLLLGPWRKQQLMINDIPYYLICAVAFKLNATATMSSPALHQRAITSTA